MSNDTKTNDLVRTCVTYAATAADMGDIHACRMLLGVAQRAMHSPQATAPVHHYAGDVREAVESLFGYSRCIADLSHTKQVRAVAMWSWAVDTFDVWVEAAVRDAIEVLKAGGHGWRQRLYDVFAADRDRFLRELAAAREEELRQHGKLLLA